MLKKIISTLITALMISSAAMATNYQTPEVMTAINKYKHGNYTGCIQDLNRYKKTHPNNQLALYYLGMAYAKAGNKDLALSNYKSAKNINPSSILGNYANKGIVCIEDSANCYINQKTETKVVTQTELDKFINRPYGNGLSTDLSNDLQRRRLERLRKEMNSDEELNKYEFKDFPVYGRKKSDASDTTVKIASKPTDAEVVKALKILNDAGLNNIAQQAQQTQQAQQAQETTSSSTVKPTNKADLTQAEYQQQLQKEMMQAQISAMAQPNVGMLFGDKNQNNNNNTMNMLPFMMMNQAQANGQNGQQLQFSPEAMQAMMFSQMMPNLNFGGSEGN